MHSKNLSRGCSLYLPVFVPGANLSMGDMHFSQGDGEVSFCGAIEMSGFLELKVSVIKGGMKMLPAVGPSPLSVNPIFEVQSSHLPLTLATYRPANQTLLPPSDNVTAFVARLAQTSESSRSRPHPPHNRPCWKRLSSSALSPHPPADWAFGAALFRVPGL